MLHSRSRLSSGVPRDWRLVACSATRLQRPLQLGMALAIELVWIKALHALSCLSSVAWGRYQVVYLNSLGLSPSRIGVLRAAGLAAKFFTIPLWGAWQDVSPTSVAPALASVASCAAGC